MRRILRIMAIASLLVIILAVSIGSVVMAARPNPVLGDPNPECPCECPDCPCDGDQHQHRYGQQEPNGNAFQHQYRSCQAE